MNCAGCGSSVPPNTKFCPTCGRFVSRSTTSTGHPASEEAPNQQTPETQLKHFLKELASTRPIAVWTRDLHRQFQERARLLERTYGTPPSHSQRLLSEHLQTLQIPTQETLETALEDYLHKVIHQSSSSIWTGQNERDYLIQVAEVGYPKELALPFLKKILQSLKMKTENEAKSDLEQQLQHSFQAGYLSLNEAENCINHWSQSYGLSIHYITNLINERCIMHRCVNALRLSNGFERFLTARLSSYSGSTLPLHERQGLIEYGTMRGLRSRCARVVFRRVCKKMNVS